MKGRKCVVCGSVSPPLFGFPNHPEKCKLWQKLIRQHTGQNIEIADFKYISKKKFICDVHFGDWCFSSTERKRLLPGARPFLNESPCQTVEPQMFNTFEKTCSPSVPVGESRNQSLVLEEGSDNTTEMDNTPEIRTETDVSVRKQRILKSGKINVLQRQVSKLRRQLLLKDKRMAKRQLLHMLQTKLNHNTYWFVMGQLMASARQPNGRRWTPKEKSMFLNIYLRSPSSYRLISRIIPVPCKNTLVQSITGFVTSPGFCLRLLATLKKVGESMSPQDKFCSLVFGEVSLKSGIKYDSKFDVIVGFESYGAKYEINHILATRALVFMIRGLSKSWKQPFGFFLTSDTIPISIFKSLVLDAIDLVTDAGFTVVCLVCDQSPTNQDLFRDLKVSITKPFYLHRQQKIFTFYDPPHLLKSLRNNFKKYNVAFDKGNVAKWEHVEQLFNLDSQNKYRIVPRLSKCHSEINKYTSMKVKRAAQVFSSSVAAGISLLISTRTLSSEACYTADFIGEMGDLFDSFNSWTLKQSKQMAASVTHNSKHEQYWKDTLEWVKSWKFIKNDGKHVQPPCKKGWILTISAVLQLREYLKSNSFESLCTNRLNQDCLENTFSMIRGKRGFRANPDSYQFISAFYTVLVHNLIKPSSYTNSENDTDELLSDLFRNYTFTPCMFQTEDSIDGNSVALPKIEEIQINTVEENAMTYIAGYLAREIISLMGNCSCCESLLTVPSHLDVNTIIVHFKEYDQTQPKLKCPSENLTAAITRFTTLFFSHFDAYLFKENISRSLYSILNEVEMDWLNHHPKHSVQMKDFLIKLYLKMMINSKVKEINKSLNCISEQQQC